MVFKQDIKIIATANPIDYTHSGEIIGRLFDRSRSHINTHYPRNTADEILIIVQEAEYLQTQDNVFLPIFILRTDSHDNGVSKPIMILIMTRCKC